MKAVVIGGGVAGLAAAHDLVKHGHEVALYEAGPILGGQVRTFEVGGGRLEVFYHHLFRSDTEIVALIDELGLGPDLEWIDSNGGMNAAGRNYPFVGPLDLLRFDRVSLLTRIRLGLAALWLRQNSNWRDYEGIRARDWITSRVGREGYDRVWGPLLRAKFGPYADDIAMTWFWGKIYLRFASREGGLFAREQLGYLRGSFGRLIDALEAKLTSDGATVATATPVERICLEDGRVTGVQLAARPSSEGSSGGGAASEDSPATPEVVPADAVIATVPSGIFARMLPELPTIDQRYAAMIDAQQYQWASVLVLALDRPLSPHYWLTMTDEDSPFVVAVEQTNVIPPGRYGGNHVVYLSRYASPDDPVMSLEADQVLDRYAPYLTRINPAFDRSWIRDHWLFVDRAGQPVVHYRYHDDIAPHRTPVPGLYLANTTQIYPEDRGQNYSIRMGRRVARLARLDHASR